MENDAQQQEAQEVFQKWSADIQSARDVRNMSLRVISERKLMVIDQKRTLFKTIIELSVGIIIAPHLLGIAQNKSLYFVGIAILSVLILFIVLLFREIIDIDFQGLQKSEDDMVKVLERKIELVEKYINGRVFTYQKNKELFAEIINTPEAKKLSELDTQLKNDRDKRDGLPKDYTGELVMFLFYSGIFWILWSIFPNYFSWIVAVLGEALILIITSLNSAQVVSKTFSMCQNFVRQPSK